MRARDSGRGGEPGGVAQTGSFMVYLTTGDVVGWSSELLPDLRVHGSITRLSCMHAPLRTVRHSLTITHRKLLGVRWLGYCEVVPDTDYCQWGCLCLSVLLSVCLSAVLSVL